MKIGVTSQNKLKLNAVATAYLKINEKPEIVGYTADSGIGEQPVGEQTLLGARNRIANVKGKVDGLDRIISIESGIFRENEQWVDRAVVVIYDVKSDKEYIGHSEGVVFPDKYVELAAALGFDQITVGSVMVKEGFVADGKDPHQSISGISRQVYLETTVAKLVKELELKEILLKDPHIVRIVKDKEYLLPVINYDALSAKNTVSFEQNVKLIFDFMNKKYYEDDFGENDEARHDWVEDRGKEYEWFSDIVKMGNCFPLSNICTASWALGPLKKEYSGQNIEEHEELIQNILSQVETIMAIDVRRYGGIPADEKMAMIRNMKAGIGDLLQFYASASANR